MRILTLLVFCTLFTACSIVSSNDGPPLRTVDVSNIRDAIPKVEPHSRYGNPASYKVFGKRYYTLNSSKDYNETGVASWYGTKFHAARTSSGEPYDMYAMTAAHKSLPLPTYARVTNLENGRSIVVKINDRGPFSNHRIIDLSYVAAKKLQMTGKGTARVRVVAIDPRQSRYQSSNPVASSEGALGAEPYIQVGAFGEYANAKQRLKALGSVVSGKTRIRKNPGETLYRVQVGPFANTKTKYRVLTELHDAGFRTVLVG